MYAGGRRREPRERIELTLAEQAKSTRSKKKHRGERCKVEQPGGAERPAQIVQFLYLQISKI